MSDWTCVLELDNRRRPVAGDSRALRDAVDRGADMRVGTAFRHNEHIDVTSSNNELIQEVMDFRVTYLIDKRWVAGIENLRVPLSIPNRFGERPSMSFFLYNEDGNQAIARPYLDGNAVMGKRGSAPVNPHAEMPKYNELANWDVGTNAPSSDFIFDFEFYRFFIRNSWQEVFAHDAGGNVESGSAERLVEAFQKGAELKVAISGLCDDLSNDPNANYPHEVFVHVGACYYYTETRLLIASANPVVRTRPRIPMGYGSGTWDFGWLMPRTDGCVMRLLCDPYTLKFRETAARHAMRWFVSR